MKEDLKKGTSFSQLEKAPFNLTPGRTILLVLMSASFLMFVFLLANMIVFFARRGEQVRLSLPEPFVIGTWLLMIVSFVMRKTRDHFQKESFLQTKRFLGLAIVLMGVFLLLQITAWWQIYGEIRQRDLGGAMVSFVFFVSGLHFLHVVVAMSLVAHQWYHFQRLTSHPARSLILFTDKRLFQRFRNAEIFCHFTDGIWILIFISLLFLS